MMTVGGKESRPRYVPLRKCSF